MLSDVKFVKKPWGWEKWVAFGLPNFPYVLKQIHTVAPNKSSYHVHMRKRESNLVLSGRGIVHISVDPVDVLKVMRNEYSEQDVEDIINSLVSYEVTKDSVFHVMPGFVHCVEAVEDMLTVEASTPELDDVFRIRDSVGRGHGRIESEHSNGFSNEV